MSQPNQLRPSRRPLIAAFALLLLPLGCDAPNADDLDAQWRGFEFDVPPSPSGGGDCDCPNCGTVDVGAMSISVGRATDLFEVLQHTDRANFEFIAPSSSFDFPAASSVDQEETEMDIETSIGRGGTYHVSMQLDPQTLSYTNVEGCQVASVSTAGFVVRRFQTTASRPNWIRMKDLPYPDQQRLIQWTLQRGTLAIEAEGAKHVLAREACFEGLPCHNLVPSLPADPSAPAEW